MFKKRQRIFYPFVIAIMLRNDAYVAPEIVTQTPSDITSSSQFVTYLGGSGVDDCDDIAVDAAGSIYLACHSTSKDFPGFISTQPIWEEQEMTLPHLQ